MMQISPKNSSRQRGFTLMELLIVMSIMIILMLIAIPNFISMKAQADETSAIQSLRAIYQSQIQYQTNFPHGGTGPAGRSRHRTEVRLHVQYRQLHQGQRQ